MWNFLSLNVPIGSCVFIIFLSSSLSTYYISLLCIIGYWAASGSILYLCIIWFVWNKLVSRKDSDAGVVFEYFLLYVNLGSYTTTE